ncbi:MAG: fatty acid desaturase [Deltaproteobacteria bacterium]|nr:fatty acid desaturase [Deltaproteobacteria bacterium]
MGARGKGAVAPKGGRGVSSAPEAPWDEGRFKEFSQEIDKLRQEIEASLGEEDVRYLKRLKKISRQMEALGRFLIFVSLDPVTWFVGVTALWIHRQLETTEIGHYALHGCWDRFPELAEYHSKSFVWKTPVEEETWKRGHNGLHHQYTNIVGKDPDVNYGALRTSKYTPWQLHHAIQVVQFFVTAPFFTEVVGIYHTGLADLLHKPNSPGHADVLPDRKLKTIGKAVAKIFRKIAPFYGYQFVLWPLLAGPFWWKVLSGNALAHLMTNIYTAASIFAGHFGDDVEYFPPEFRAKSRGEYYKAQVRAAHNFTAPLPLEILAGTLSAQIEHHLFPKFPPNRLRQLRNKVKEICARYGVGYAEDTWWNTLKKTMAHLWKMSSPERSPLQAIAQKSGLPLRQQTKLLVNFRSPKHRASSESRQPPHGATR